MSRVAGVGLRVSVYLDRSRTQLNYLTGRSTPGRRIATEIRYPTAHKGPGEIQNAPPLIGSAPYPVIVFAEGYNTKPDLYRSLLDGWVRAGYVVVAPEFPDTTYPISQTVMNAGDPHGSPESDIVNEPADLSFVIGTVTRYSTRPSSFLFGLFDPDRVLLAGHSDGASVVGAYVFDRQVASNLTSVRGVAIFAGDELSPDPYGEPTARAIPAFIAQSSGDTCNRPGLSVEFYNSLGGERYFLELLGSTHLGPFNNTNPAAKAIVQATTLAFFAHVLAPNKIKASPILQIGNQVGRSSAIAAGIHPPIATPPGSPYCAPAY